VCVESRHCHVRWIVSASLLSWLQG
jgi:hypothetical protein